MDTEKNSAAEMLHGANNANLRKQVCTFVFFSFSSVRVGGARFFFSLTDVILPTTG